MAVTNSLKDRKSIRFFANVAIPNVDVAMLTNVDTKTQINKVLIAAVALIGTSINCSRKMMITTIGTHKRALIKIFANEADA